MRLLNIRKQKRIQLLPPLETAWTKTPGTIFFFHFDVWLSHYDQICKNTIIRSHNGTKLKIHFLVFQVC